MKNNYKKNRKFNNKNKNNKNYNNKFNKKIGTRPALTMSVPVRYTAAANYAVVASGLSNTLQQEEQYHQQQQQVLYNNNNQELSNNNNSSTNDLDQQQQQLMQQRSSMSLSVSPSKQHSSFTGTMPATNNNNFDTTNTSTSNTCANNMDEFVNASEVATLSKMNVESETETAAQVLDEQVDLEAAAAAAVNADINNHNNDHDDRSVNVSDDNAEMQTECSMTMSEDEGRYGTPGAAGLEYQKYELEQQQLAQQQDLTTATNPTGNVHVDNESNTDQPMNDTLNKDRAYCFSSAHLSHMKMEAELLARPSEEHYKLLKEYFVLQDKYHTVLLMPKQSKKEVTAGGRDGSAYVLRCLKMWYELPSDVLFSAMSLVDRFLDRMAVKPKHMACLSVASFHLAIKQMNLKPIPPEDLVTISQCGCTAGDLERMSAVIVDKLGVQMGVTPITSVHFLRLYYALFYNLAKEVGDPFFDFFKNYIKLEEMENRLEVLLCDVKTTTVTPSTLALCLISLHLDFHIKASYPRGVPELKVVFDFIIHVQNFMTINDRVFTCGFSSVAGILHNYNGQNKQPYKQRLVWRLSTRTLRLLRPTKSFSTDLATIEEGNLNAMDDDDDCRSRSESISSEEEEDWPTSPIIPIFEQC